MPTRWAGASPPDRTRWSRTSPCGSGCSPYPSGFAPSCTRRPRWRGPCGLFPTCGDLRQGPRLLRKIVQRDVQGARQGAQGRNRALFTAGFDFRHSDAVDPGPLGQCGLSQTAQVSIDA
jgi:hypothetical protein